MSIRDTIVKTSKLLNMEVVAITEECADFDLRTLEHIAAMLQDAIMKVREEKGMPF